ncbi:hypothetical protein [Barrientosiimonas humi]|uniref:hypothetical protein n=1 Tax=Barrientosiimonas humi TaxID=999931 RepID=UPI00370D11F5
MSSNTAPIPGEGMWSDQQPPADEAARAREVFEHLMCEDGLLGALETMLSGVEVAGTDPVTLQLEGMKLLAADVARRMNQADPFTIERDDAWFDPADLPQGKGNEPGAKVDAAGSDPAGAGTAPAAAAATDDAPPDVTVHAGAAAEMPQAWRDADEAAARLARFEDVTVLAHQLMNQAGAVRAYAVERCARFDTAPDSARWSATDCLAGDAPRPGDVTEHPAGHRGRFAGDLLAPSLRLGPHAADSMVDEAVWLTQRVPAVLAEVARGEANLDTAAAIAREVQDARPDTCELVEEAVLGREVHHRSTTQARRSARTLVERFEASAARTTLRRTQAQHTGVWLDPHTTPGLSALTAVMPTGQAASVMDAVDQRARAAQQEAKSGDGAGEALLLGQHRANALHDLALGNVELIAHLELIVPPGGPPPQSDARPPAGGSPPTGKGGSSPAAGSPTERDVSPPEGDGSAAVPCQHPDDDPCAVSASATRAAAATSARSTLTLEQAAAILKNSATVVVHDRAGPVPTEQVIQLLSERAARVTVERFDPHALADDLPEERSVAPPAAGSNGYRPGARLRRAVKRRDRRCRYPGCDRRALFTDLDHVEPWPRGRTTATNLQNLCRHHHCTKHEAGWRVVMTPDGTCTWTSPTGRTHTTRPGLLELLDDLAYPVSLDR